MEETSEPLSLTNVMNGAAVEMFARQLTRVLNNLSDINTDLNAREITLKVKFTPSKDRSYIGIEIKCPPAKLSGQEAAETTADLKMDTTGRIFARERIDAQSTFAFKFGNVENLKKGE